MKLLSDAIEPHWWQVNIGSGNAVRHQAITWANVDQTLCRSMASKASTSWSLNYRQVSNIRRTLVGN